MAKLSAFVLQCSQVGRWVLLFYSHGLFYALSSLTSLNYPLYVLLAWFFVQYQLAIFLVSAVRPRSTDLSSKCPICALHFSDRFHHCFFVNRCIAKCNVHCFLSFTFYATISTLTVFFVFLQHFIWADSVNSACLLPLGEFLCSQITWKQSGLIMLTRSALISAGAAGFMGFHVATELYRDHKDPSRSILFETMKILFPTISLIQYA